MTLYRYRACGKEGTLHRGVMDVPSPYELKAQLRALELSLITYSCSLRGLQDIFSFLPRKIKTSVLIDFCVHLEQFENAGISLTESLEVLVYTTENPKLKGILSALLRDVERGFLFSKALANHPAIFDSVFVGLVCASEKTGRLSFVLQHLIHHLKWEDEVHAKIF